VVRVGHDGADIVEDCAKDLLKMLGPFLEVSGVGDVKDAMRLRARQAFDRSVWASSTVENVGAERAPGARFVVDEKSARAIDHLFGSG
jgi:hypothetical protein